MKQTNKRNKPSPKRLKTPIKGLFFPKNKTAFKKHQFEIRIISRVRKSVISPFQKKIKKTIKDILTGEGVEFTQLSVVLVDEVFIRSLNRKFSGKDAVTDVIAFDHRPKGFKKNIMLADIIVCVDRAVKCARKFNISFKEELFRYIIHGILHLRGFDDTTAIMRRKMWKRQEEILEDYL